MIASPPDHVIPARTAAYFFHGKDGRADSEVYFGRDWSVTARGPLAPLVIAAAGRLLGEEFPDPPGSSLEAWPASRDVFYLPRIVGVLTNALVLLAGAALATRLAGAAAGTLALVWLAAAPVVAINADFLWPKLLATFFVVLAVDGIISRQSWLRIAGLAALAYYSHPVGGLMVPPLLLFLIVREWHAAGGTPVAVLRAACLVGLGLALALAPWFAYKLWLGHHDVFLRYPLGDGRGFLPAESVASWLGCRFDNLWLTLLPGGFFLSQQMQSWTEGPISEPLRWAIANAKTLPGGVGIAAFFLSLFALARRPAAVATGFRACLLLAALALMLVFWGYSFDGLGRNCLEPLAVLLIIYSAAIGSPEWRGWPWIIAVTALETLFVRMVGITGEPAFSASSIGVEPLILGALCGLTTLLPAAAFAWSRVRPR